MTIELSEADWLNILDALCLAEDDRMEQAKYAMDDEDRQTCMDAAAAYAGIAAVIHGQMEKGDRK